MSKGKFVLIPFPFTDLSGQKVRPALVLHASKGEDCIVAFISSTVPKKKRPFDLHIKASQQNGLKSDSVIKLDKLATLQKTIILGELGKGGEPMMRAVDSMLKKLFQI
jgi:mRNA interferase MazF